MSSEMYEWRMWIFYSIVWLQHDVPLCPRCTLVPQKEEISTPEPAGAVS